MKANLVRFVQILLGLVFVFSSVVKAIDPLGTVYKLQDYFAVLGLGFLSGVSLVLAILLISLEFVIGIMLIFNWFSRLGLILATLLIGIFTPLTLYLAIANPISDCGCFGDALKLSNWQTFWKNVIFALMLVFLWLNRQTLFASGKRSSKAFVGILASLILILAFEAYNLLYLPVIDFRPYRVSVDLKQALARQDSVYYETVLIYRNKKTGKLQEFGEDNYPWQDTVNWEWVDTKVKEIKVKRGSEGIHDFYFTDMRGQDLTQELLNLPKPVIIIIAYDLEQVNVKGLRRILEFFDKNREKFYPTIYCATASAKEQIQNFISKYPEFARIVFLNSDATTLKTIVRANPGLIVIDKGMLVDKRSWRSVR